MLGHKNRERDHDDDGDYDSDNEARDDELIPKKVEAFWADEVIIVDVACGDYHTCVVTSTGSIFTWGNGTVWLPTRLQDLSSEGVVSVSAHHYHTACVTKAGEVFTWGRGEYGKLGHGDENDQQTPKRVEALVDVEGTMVSCGRYRTAVCTKDGHMYTFGNGVFGQLGYGDKENTSSPVLVQALVGKFIKQVQCGLSHTMALTSSGYVFTWGNATTGALGHGNVKLKHFSFPCVVEGLREHNVVQISSCANHCAVLVDPTGPSSIRQSQQALSINNQEHSDVVFMIGNQPLKVLTQKSDYFAGMFRSNMRESIERVVQVPNCSRAAFFNVLKFLSLDDFTVNIDDVVEVWGLADMYQMEGLKHSCMGVLERGLSGDNVSEILQEVEDLSCPCDELKSMCHEYLQMMTRISRVGLKKT
jgi:alpha-tubulin suppressor-like RCC1 family protein